MLWNLTLDGVWPASSHHPADRIPTLWIWWSFSLCAHWSARSSYQVCSKDGRIFCRRKWNSEAENARHRFLRKWIFPIVGHPLKPCNILLQSTDRSFSKCSLLHPSLPQSPYHYGARYIAYHPQQHLSSSWFLLLGSGSLWPICFYCCALHYNYLVFCQYLDLS